MNETLGNDLKDAREAAGLTQGALAEAIGVSRKTINTVGERRLPALDPARAQAGASLGTPVESLFWIVD